MENSFSSNGFLIIKKAISRKLLLNFQKAALDNYNHNKNNDAKNYYNQFCQKVKSLKTSEFEFVKPIHELLFYKGLLDEILLEKKIYAEITNLLGKDLSYTLDPGLSLNLPNKSSNKKNYLFKDWHQEIWSGASTSEVQIWTPIFQKNSNQDMG